MQGMHSRCSSSDVIFMLPSISSAMIPTQWEVWLDQCTSGRMIVWRYIVMTTLFDWISLIFVVVILSSIQAAHWFNALQSRVIVKVFVMGKVINHFAWRKSGNFWGYIRKNYEVIILWQHLSQVTERLRRTPLQIQLAHLRENNADNRAQKTGQACVRNKRKVSVIRTVLQGQVKMC
jgi:hypothetical protein